MRVPAVRMLQDLCVSSVNKAAVSAKLSITTDMQALHSGHSTEADNTVKHAICIT